MRPDLAQYAEFCWMALSESDPQISCSTPRDEVLRACADVVASSDTHAETAARSTLPATKQR